MEVGSIRRIQGIGYGILEFLRVGTTLDIFQNIHILYLEYGVLVFSGYGVLSLLPLWSLVSAGTDTHGYAVSSLMDTAYWLSESLTFKISSFKLQNARLLLIFTNYLVVITSRMDNRVSISIFNDSQQAEDVLELGLDQSDDGKVVAVSKL
ncbi:hypothetical protein Tco_1386972 [Tanacetum coccineum]